MRYADPFPINPTRVREMFDYDPETGVLIRLFGYKKGLPAGTSDPRGYLKVHFEGRSYYVHRLVWAHYHDKPPTLLIDHVDGVKSNNRIDNLREATGSQNIINTGLKSHNKTGFKGVTMRRGVFRATIKVGGKHQDLGTFKSAEEAALAYDAAALVGHGSFARTNNYKWEA